MNSGFKKLHAYPFERLSALFDGITPADKRFISLAIGEPKHPTPEFILNTLKENSGDIAYYPTTKGIRASLKIAQSDIITLPPKLS